MPPDEMTWESELGIAPGAVLAELGGERSSSADASGPRCPACGHAQAVGNSCAVCGQPFGRQPTAADARAAAVSSNSDLSAPDPPPVEESAVALLGGDALLEELPGPMHRPVRPAAETPEAVAESSLAVARAAHYERAVLALIEMAEDQGRPLDAAHEGRLWGWAARKSLGLAEGEHEPASPAAPARSAPRRSAAASPPGSPGLLGALRESSAEREAAPARSAAPASSVSSAPGWAESLGESAGRQLDVDAMLAEVA